MLPTSDKPRLIAYTVCPHPAPIIKSTVERDWMERTAEKFAYRCLPLVIANQLGWDIINQVPFTVFWNGGTAKDAIVFSWNTGATDNTALSHFGHGVLTFSIPYLFRTPPGINLLVKGPANLPKDGIQALEGVVETDWANSTFTMNWLFTRPNHLVSFQAGEPICHIIPIPRHVTENVDPVILSITDDPVAQAEYERWRVHRDKFNAHLNVRDPAATKQGWQKDYFKGSAIPEHQTKLHQAEFRRG